MMDHWGRGEFSISTRRDYLQLDVVHEFLTRSYWATGISLATLRRSIDHSMPFGVYHGSELIGFARVITDRATFAYLADVFVLPAFRGRGLAKWLLDVILAHPELSGLRAWYLRTRDAHGLYRQFGFTVIEQPETYMRRPGTSAIRPK